MKNFFLLNTTLRKFSYFKRSKFQDSRNLCYNLHHNIFIMLNKEKF